MYQYDIYIIYVFFFRFGLISISTRLINTKSLKTTVVVPWIPIYDGFHMFPSCLDSISMSVTYNLVPVFDHPKPSVSENSTALKLLKQMTTYTGSYVILCPSYVHFWTRKSRALQVSSVSVSRLSSAWCGDSASARMVRISPGKRMWTRCGRQQHYNPI